MEECRSPYFRNLSKRIAVYKKGNHLILLSQYSNAMMRRVRENVLAQRAPKAENEQRAFPRNKPLSSMSEPSMVMA